MVVVWKSHIAPAARTRAAITTLTTLGRILTLLAARLAAAADYGIVPVAEQHLFRVSQIVHLARRLFEQRPPDVLFVEQVA
jgi:hypothetical protein